MMAQIISTICDAHLALDDAPEVEAKPYRVSVAVPGQTPRQMLIDLCPEHAAPLLSVWQAVEEMGRPEAANGAVRAASPGSFVCPVCGRHFASSGSLSGHTRGQHGKPLGELRGTASGERLPCPACERTFPSPQALGRHSKAIHGASVSLLRERAKADTPPEAPKARKRAPSASDGPSETAGAA